MSPEAVERALHVDVLRTLSVAGPLRAREVEAVRYAIAQLEALDHEARTARAEEDTREFPVVPR